jgi:hypothetical protein
MSPPSTAVSVLPQSPIAKIEDLRAHIEKVCKVANFVSPFTGMDYIPEMHRVSFRTVVIDPTLRKVGSGDYVNEIGTDTYRDKKFCQENERALTKTGILKLLRAAGIDVVRSQRTDDRKDALYAEWVVEIEIPELDGRRSRMTATRTIDLRPGSPQREKMTDKQAGQAVQVILENAETKALLRAARAGLQLRQKYTIDELSKPFVIPVLVPDLDTSDPEIKRMVAANALGITEKLYGPPKAQAPARTIEVGGDEVNVSTGEVIDDDHAADANAAAAAEDLSDFGELPAAPAPAEPKCACPCGCTQVVSTLVAEMTRERGGAVRCRECWPGKSFVMEHHRNLTSLGLKPDVTPAQAAAAAGGAR